MITIRVTMTIAGIITVICMCFTPAGWALFALAIILLVCLTAVVWTCGGFDRDVWFGPSEDETHPGTLSRLDRLDGVGTRKADR